MYVPKMIYTVKTMYFISHYNHQNTGIYSVIMGSQLVARKL